jgi:pimeloyl-ACP methyl ester carboxylesterase
VASRGRSLAQLPNWLADGPIGWVGSNARGSTQPHLQGKDLEETLIYFSSLEKQKMAVARIERAFSWMFTSQFIPEGTKEQADWFNDLQRKTTSPECAARYFEVVGNFDVRELLPQVQVPTLVMHVRGDLMAPIDAGRQMAAGIPGARFIALPGRNHLFLKHEPAAARFFEEINLF